MADWTNISPAITQQLLDGHRGFWICDQRGESQTERRWWTVRTICGRCQRSVKFAQEVTEAEAERLALSTDYLCVDCE